MNIKTAIANDVKLAASAKLAGDFYDDMLLRSNKFYENTAPLQPKIAPTNKAPGAKANLRPCRSGSVACRGRWYLSN